VLVIYPDQKVVIAWLQNSDDFRDCPCLRLLLHSFLIAAKFNRLKQEQVKFASPTETGPHMSCTSLMRPGRFLGCRAFTR
jgi:hypothetical protein